MKIATPLFSDRVDAGRRLGRKLTRLRGQDVVVLGLPRGGVPVAAQVAEELNAPLDVIVVRKLGVPWQPELGMGAIGEDGVRVLNQRVINLAGIGDEQLAAVERTELAALRRRAGLLRGDRPAIDLAGRTVVIVDDGIATGSTARAAAWVARARGAARVVLAVPVAPTDAIGPLLRDCDEVVAVRSLHRLSSVGQSYEDFTPTTDDEVRDLLIQHRAASHPAPVRAHWHDEQVVACPRTLRLPGRLTVPAGADGLVVFAHGSGSSMRSPRNEYLAAVMHQGGLATLLFDLLTPDEAADRDQVFDIARLAHRLTEVTAWAREHPLCATLPVGWCGASTGAAAALWAAAEPHADIAAIVSRSGRPDLAGWRLSAVTAPTLLIVGGRDTRVLALNRAAQAQLRCPSQLIVVPGATHLFEEPGTLTTAALQARGWFVKHGLRQATGFRA